MVYNFQNPENVTRQAVQYKTTTPVDYFRTNYNYYQAQAGFNSIWNLSSISSTTTGAVISYSYTPGEQQVSNNYFTVIQPTYATQADTLYYIKDTSTPLFLSSITLKSYSINITWANSLISKITISENESGDTKEYDLIYKSVKSSSDNAYPIIYKPFLMAIKQLKSCVAYPSYAFTYQGVDTVNAVVNVPWRTGWGQDFFGYYNGQNSNKNIPPIFFYSAESGPGGIG